MIVVGEGVDVLLRLECLVLWQWSMSDDRLDNRLNNRLYILMRVRRFIKLLFKLLWLLLQPELLRSVVSGHRLDNLLHILCRLLLHGISTYQLLLLQLWRLHVVLFVNSSLLHELLLEWYIMFPVKLEFLHLQGLQPK